MNPEGMKPTAAENKESKIPNKNLQKTLGDLAIKLDTEYRAEDENKEKAEQEKVQQEQVQNQEKINELKAQMEALQVEQANLIAEQQRHEAEILNIQKERKEKSIAMKKGLIGMTG